MSSVCHDVQSCMSDDKTNQLGLKMMIFLSTEIDDEHLELLYDYTKQHTLDEFISHIQVAKETKSLLQTE
jgi:hypothetical protein